MIPPPLDRGGEMIPPPLDRGGGMNPPPQDQDKNVYFNFSRRWRMIPPPQEEVVG